MKQLLRIFFLFFAMHSFAQDTIVKKDNTRVPANITEVKPGEISYRLPGYSDGPVFTIKKSEVGSVIYRNGMTESYSGSNQDPVGSMRHKQSLSLNSTDLTFGLISLSWELQLLRDKLSMRVPLSTGVSAFSNNSSSMGNYDNYYYTRFKIFSGGIDLLYYPLGQKKVVNYFTGVATEIGYTKMSQGWYIDFAPYPNFPQKVWYGGAGITNGVLINVNQRMSISPYVTVGMKYGRDIYYSYNNSPAMCRAGVNMSIRFGRSNLFKSGSIVDF